MTDAHSRYRKVILFKDGPWEFLGTRPEIDTTPRPDDQFHTVVAGDRIDRLAFEYLGRADWWWVICDWNGIAFPLELEPGLVLRIPSKEHMVLNVLS